MQQNTRIYDNDDDDNDGDLLLLLLLLLLLSSSSSSSSSSLLLLKPGLHGASRMLRRNTLLIISISVWKKFQQVTLSAYVWAYT